MAKNTTPNPKADNKETSSDQSLIIVQLVKDAYGEYKIGGQLNSWVEVKKELAERMIESGHAILVK